MTRNRQRVLAEMTEAALHGEPITLARLARRCGIYDYKEARRIVSDLRKLGREPACQWERWANQFGGS